MRTSLLKARAVVATMAFVASCVFVLSLAAPASAVETPPAAMEKTASGLSIQANPSEMVLAPDSEVEIHIMLRIVAPVIAPAKARAPLNLALVIDRSGSMSDSGKLDYAIRAGKEVVRLLSPTDQLAIIDYDDNVKVLSALAPVKDKAKLNKLLEGLEPGGYTFLSGGLEAGINQLKKNSKPGVNRVILLSDGLANRGVTEAKDLGNMGASAKDKGITISSMGLGLEYDENLMQLLAQRGGGQYSYVRDSEDLPGFFRQELSLAAESVTKDLKLRFVPGQGMRDIKVYGYTTTPDKDNTIGVEMGDMYSGEERQVLIRAKVKAGSAAVQDLGKAEVRFALMGSDAVQSIDLPVQVGVVADAAERKTQNTKAEAQTKPVREEALLLDAEEAHVAAMDAMQQGNEAEARRIMGDAKASLAAAAPDNAAAANKMQVLAADEAQLSQAMSSPELQQGMAKKSKGSFYMSSQGKSDYLMLQPGDKGAMVEKLQRALAAKNLYTGEVDGVFSDAVEKAVRAFQKDNNLTVDGIAGQATMDALGM